MIDIRHGDCMDYMRSLPDKSFDLAIVDPPYGLGEESVNGRGKLGTRIFNRSKIHTWDIRPEQTYFDELFRVSKNQIIWGGNYFPLPPCRGFVIWHKKQPFPNFSQAEFAWTSFNTPSKIFEFDCRNIENKIHPTQKPVQLYKFLLQNFAKAGDKILDTHLGSGSIAIACHDDGFELTGTEINPEFYQNASKRINAYTAQEKLLLED